MAEVINPEEEKNKGSVGSQVEQGDGDVSVNPGGQPTSDVTGYDQQIALLQEAAKRYAPESDEDKIKREKRERSAKIIGAVSDGLSALGNLYFTSQYAPDMFERENGQLKTTNDKLDRLKAERQANADKYLNFALKIGDAQNEKAKTLRDIAAQQEAQRLAKEKEAREKEKQNWERDLQPDKRREQEGKADKAGYDAETSRVKSEYAPRQAEAELETEGAKRDSYRASAANSYASAEEHKAKATKTKEESNQFSAWDEYGNEHKFKSEEAALLYAEQHGTLKEEDIEETTLTDSELNGKTTSTKKKKRRYAAKPERESPTAN